MGNSTRVTIVMSPESEPYKQLSKGCKAKFFKEGTKLGGVPHVTLSKSKSGNKGYHTPDGMWRVDFGHLDEMVSMPRYGLSLADRPPVKLKKGKWMFPLPKIKAPIRGRRPAD
jgi:hypothetical protein